MENDSQRWEMAGKAIDIIERDIGKPLSLDSISRDVGLSKFYLDRLFKALTGSTLMAYARGRKLTRSLHDLLDTQLRVIDIADEYGFAYEQSYERSFRQLFQISPSDFRKEKPQLPIVRIPCLGELTSVFQGRVLKPVLVLKPQFRLMGIETEVVHTQNFQELTANTLAQEFYYDKSRQIGKKVRAHVYYGLVRYSGHSDISDFYIPSVEVEAGQNALPGFVRHRLPVSEYAVFKYIGFHSPEQLTIRTLYEVYDYVDQWFFTTKYRLSGNFHFERLDRRLCRRDFCEMDIYMPVSDQPGGRVTI